MTAQAGEGLSAGPVRVFRSNSLGMPLEEISEYRRDEFDFVLERAEGSGKTEAVLFRQGREEARWERFYGAGGMLEEEKEARGEEVTHRIYRSGLLVEETVSLAGIPGEKTLFTYRNGQIGEIRRIGGDGTAPETVITYRLGPDGRLLGVYQRADGEEERRTEFTYSPNGGYGEWHQGNERAEYYRFNQGRPILQEQWQNRVLTERIVWTEEEDRPLRVREFPEEGRTVLDLLDKDGRIIGQEERTPEETIYREFTYQDGRVTRLLERRPGEKLRYTYVYGTDGLSEERMERNDLLATRILYLPEGVERHETYRRGLLLAVVEYENGIPLEGER